MAQPDNILDTPTTIPENSTYKWLRRIAIGLEIAIWFFLGLIAALFKLESWEGSDELLILFFTTLALFYLLFTFLVTGAKGRNRLLAAAGVGIALFVHLIGSLFILESWEFGGGIRALSYILGIVAVCLAIYYLFQSRKAGSSIAFHANILVRLVLVFYLA
jgi:hypothetical protein